MRCVFIYGPVASGKLTVATALNTITGLPVFHNHYAVDAALSLFEFGSPGFVRLRELIWLSAFKEAALTDRSFIFTFNPEASVPPTFISAATSAIESAGGTVLYVSLECSEAVIESRISESSRSQYGKITSAEQYRFLRNSGAFTFAPLPSPHLLINTHNVSPEDAALQIHSLLESQAA
jgi:deoxyadenosine/deoxycytidine kinase